MFSRISARRVALRFHNLNQSAISIVSAIGMAPRRARASKNAPRGKTVARRIGANALTSLAEIVLGA
jgi:hypothetical protein